MLVLSLIVIMFANSINLNQKFINSIFITRITILSLIVSIILNLNVLYFQGIGKGICLYNDLFQITIQSQTIEIFLLFIGASILFGWPNKVVLSNTIKGNKSSTFKKVDQVTEETIQQRPRYKAEETEIIDLQNLNIDLQFLDSEEYRNNISINKSEQYSLIALFSILGGSLLMASFDLLSMYLSIELQSFALYILATLNKDKLSSAFAGLKYFLLGGLSSCFILLGSAIIYSYTGLTHFESINSLISIPLNPGLSLDLIANFSLPEAQNVEFSDVTSNYEHVKSTFSQVFDLQRLPEKFSPEINKPFTIGLTILIVGFLFKLSAAPFYQWAPDVYDASPTIVTVWLTIIAKLTIFIFIQGFIDFPLPNTTGLLNLDSSLIPFYVMVNESTKQITEEIFNYNYIYSNLDESAYIIKNLLFICSLLSLLIGTIAGLSQIKIKRLLAFSSISHVGFLLLALGIYTQNSIDSFIFYLVQYSITSLNIFLILLALSYFISHLRSTLNNTHEGLKPLSYETTKIDVKLEAKGTEIDLNYLDELIGQLIKNPILSFSLAICLFSMAGVPPLIGFFSKQLVLFSAIENGNYFLSLIAILVSVVSASYYLKIIKLVFFYDVTNVLPLLTSGTRMDQNKKREHMLDALRGLEKINLKVWISKIINNWEANNYTNNSLTFVLRNGKIVSLNISLIHTYIISVLTFTLLFFFLNPSIFLNGTKLISMTIFNL